jgi:uroporphyrinogen-III synthase
MSLSPLQGFVIGITADRRAAEQAELFARRGASILHGPTLSTRYLGAEGLLRTATEAVIAHPPDYLVATTGIGVRAWFEAAQSWGRVEALLDALRATRILARGQKAAAALTIAGLDPDESRPGERMADLLDHLRAEGVAGRSIAVQHYGAPDHRSVGILEGWGARVVEVPVYSYGLPDDVTAANQLIDAVVNQRVDAVTFTSAPSVVHLVRLAEQLGADTALVGAFNASQVLAACIGEVCAAAAHEVGITTAVVPPKGRLGLLVRCLTDALNEKRLTVLVGNKRMVVQGRAVEVDGDTIALTNTERGVLRLLLRSPGAVVPKQRLIRPADPALPSTAEALHTTLSRLRRSLGQAGTALRTVRGRGYAFDATPAPVPCRSDRSS